jgi:hypothetical protein
MLLTKHFSPETYARALDSWNWLPIASKAPVMASLFGDVFLQDWRGRRDYWFLSSLDATLTRAAGTAAELDAILATDEGQDDYLLGGLAMAADRRGLKLRPDEVYSFGIAPVLGGTFGAENIVVRLFVVSLNVAGQLHEQIRNIPPGTPIGSFIFEEPAP